MRTIHLITVAVVSVALIGSAHAQEQGRPEPDKQTAAAGGDERAAMEKEVDEAVAAIRAFSTSRRDEAVRRAKQAQDDMDRRIQRLEQEWQADAERRSAAMRATRDTALAELRSQRAELAVQYRRLQESSTETWIRTREGFVDDYGDLAEALSDAIGRQSPQPPADAAGHGDASPPAEDQETPPEDGRP